MAETGFIRFLRTKKYYAIDFLEPILALPIAYGFISFLNGLNETALITAVVIFLIYTPLVLAVFKWRRK